MTKLREVINFKAAVVGAIFLTALSGFVSESAEAGVGGAGQYHSEDCIILSMLGIPCYIDPLPGTLKEGRITAIYNKDKVSIKDFGWFGMFSDQPQTPPPETGNGLFPDRNAPFDLLDPNPQLDISVCTSEDIFSEETFQEGCSFNPFEPVNEEFDRGFDFDFATEDFLAIDFNPGSQGLQVDTDESFNFFGILYEINQDAFDESDPIAGIRLVEPGTGDFGLVPEPGFNLINCIPLDAPSDSETATDTCGEQNPSLDQTIITQSEVLSASQQPGFTFNRDTNEGFFPNGDPFQLIDGSSIPPEKVNEPHNNLGLLALGLFGSNLAVKRRRKSHKSS